MCLTNFTNTVVDFVLKENSVVDIDHILIGMQYWYCNPGHADDIVLQIFNPDGRAVC